MCLSAGDQPKHGTFFNNVYFTFDLGSIIECERPLSPGGIRVGFNVFVKIIPFNSQSQKSDDCTYTECVICSVPEGSSTSHTQSVVFLPGIKDW